MCIKLVLIAGIILFVDGTKIRASAGRGRSHDRRHYEKRLAELDERVEKLIEESERVDEEQEGLGSSVAMAQELGKAERLKKKIQEVLKGFEDKDRELINETDPDCALMHSVQGSHASYNVQAVADDKHGLIVHAEAVSDTSDVNQFAVQIEKANEMLDKPCEVAVADAGYADSEELKKIDDQQIKVVVPSQRQALHQEEGPFSKSHFRYDAKQDCYFCPEGQKLSYMGTTRSSGERHYQITHPKLCHHCIHYGQCTSAKKGRKIVRLALEGIKEKLEAQYEATKEIYDRRKERAELPFGHMKSNLKTVRFLLRGKLGVNAETSLLGTCFNLARMITIVGISALTERLTALRVPVPA
jgi:hypothetical protein